MNSYIWIAYILEQDKKYFLWLFIMFTMNSLDHKMQHQSQQAQDYIIKQKIVHLHKSGQLLSDILQNSILSLLLFSIYMIQVFKIHTKDHRTWNKQNYAQTCKT